MKMKRISTLTALGVLWAASGTAAAVPITDPSGDFLATYADSGRPLGADLDVVAAEVIYHPGSQQFQFVGTLAGAIGTTPAAGGESVLYVWGSIAGRAPSDSWRAAPPSAMAWPSTPW